MYVYVQGDFFNWASPENVSRLAPPKNALTGPPHFEKVLSMAAERGEIPNTLTFSIPRRGQSEANSGEVQLKNHSVSSCDGKVYIGFENIKHVCCVKS